MKRVAFLFLFLFSSLLTWSQHYFQTIKGRVIDKESKTPIVGAVVRLASDTTFTWVTTSDAEGYFKLEKIAIGRRDFIISYIGYKPLTIPDVVISSAKEVVLNIELEESLQETQEVIVTNTDKSGTINDMTSVSTRMFRVEETERYPGSRQDPARMVTNFAGVQGSNDTRNDIVIRGNSPSSLLWRLEEVDIPNPNHFNVAGAMGGPVSIINNKYLAASDFMTGAFPAMYGNAIGGVFDVRMRNGNTEKHENTFQFGALGAELTTEGPFKKGSRASYLATYRYSTLQLLQGLQVKIGTDAVPNYQDAGFKINLPTKKAGVFTIWGIGGISSIDIIVSTAKSLSEVSEAYGQKNRDQYFSSNMGVIGVSHFYPINKKTFIKTILSQSTQHVQDVDQLVLRGNDGVVIPPFPEILHFDIREAKTTLGFYVNRKISSRSSYRTGFYTALFYDHFQDQIKIVGVTDSTPAMVESIPFKTRLNQTSTYILIQPYLQWRYKLRENLTLNVGLHAQMLSLNNTWVVEPRAGMRWDFKPKQTLSIGYGMHSQMQASYMYFAIPDTLVVNGIKTPNVQREESNKKLGFTRSQHFVLGYDFNVSKVFRIKLETYYQYLWNIPVYKIPSGISLVNQGATFTSFFPQYSMQNSGTGQNYGLELTLEKFFSKRYFFLFSGSLFQSKYQGSNGITYSTDFNGNYVTNLLTGYELPLGATKKNTLNFASKLTYAGGRRYSPVDAEASSKIYDIVPQQDKINSLQFPAYFRFDLRFAYKVNNKKVSHEIALDLVNVFDTKNVLALSYSPDPQHPNENPVVKTYQLGRLPLFYYKIDF
jgi:hypothetical protein